MNNVVLKAVFAENYAVFAQRAYFSTEVLQGKKENLYTTFEEGGSRFNKVSFLYGANGSGKSYFCRILREIQRFLMLAPVITAPNSSQFLSSPPFRGLDANAKPFAFDTEFIDKPTTFGIEIVINGVTYDYQFSVQGITVVYERLTKKIKRTEKLLERTSPDNKNIILRSELKDFSLLLHTVKPETLSLPIAAMLNNPLAEKIVTAINDIKVVNMAAGHLSPLNPQKTFSEDRLKKYLHIMQKADPTIRKINVSTSEEETKRQVTENDDFENKGIIAKKTRVNVDTMHAVYCNGQEQEPQTSITFFADESLGTIKLFTALPYLFDVLESGGTFVVDELENGLHLSLAKEIIGLFTSDMTNPHNAQLICTSHQPLLLDGNFRRDQVWVTSKDEKGHGSLIRFSDFKTSRAQVNLTSYILRGAFGCNPEMFFDNSTF